MKYCKKCLYPDIKPGLIFDEEGVCDPCRNHERKNEINWDAKREQFLELIGKFKSKDGSMYDCVIPVSGGKDSHYQAYFVKKEFGLNNKFKSRVLRKTKDKKNYKEYYDKMMIQSVTHSFELNASF